LAKPAGIYVRVCIRILSIDISRLICLCDVPKIGPLLMTANVCKIPELICMIPFALYAILSQIQNISIFIKFVTFASPGKSP